LTSQDFGPLVLFLIAAPLSTIWFFWRLGFKRGAVSGEAIEQRRSNDIRQDNRELKSENRGLGEELQKLKKEIEARQAGGITAEEQELLALRHQISATTGDVWSLRKPAPPLHLAERLIASGIPIYLIGNLKGGVGKTTIASNLAAYFDIHCQKKVLVIDFDYQGSLSSVFLRAANRTHPGSLADYLLAGDADRNWLLNDTITISNLPNTKIIPASYSLAFTEERLMLNWLFHKTDRDVRFNVAQSLFQLKPSQDFDVVIIDVGPRLTTAFISAICAATHLIVPTNLDRLAAETIESFLKRIQDIKKEFGLPIRLAGVVGTLMARDGLTEDETLALTTVEEGLKGWGDDAHIFKSLVPRRKAIMESAGANIGYLVSGPGRRFVRSTFDAFGDELLTRTAK
jgi:cellulose biosynthesis protein BcsQ